MFCFEKPSKHLVKLPVLVIFWQILDKLLSICLSNLCLRWPPDGPKMAPRWPQEASRCTSRNQQKYYVKSTFWPLRCPMMAQRWPQDGPKMAPRWPQDASRSFKMHQQKPATILGKIDILAIKMLQVLAKHVFHRVFWLSKTRYFEKPLKIVCKMAFFDKTDPTV